MLYQHPLRTEIITLMRCYEPIIKNVDLARHLGVAPGTITIWLKAPTLKQAEKMKQAIKEIRENEQATR